MRNTTPLSSPSSYYHLPPLPTLPITSNETLHKCKSLLVGPNDIFIASFPKSGTTWMQNIVVQLLMQSAQRGNKNQKDDETLSPLAFQHISQYAPFYDIDAHWTEDGNILPQFQEAHRALGYRVFNTHLRWDMLPKSSSSSTSTSTDDVSASPKYIYVVRDGRDVLTSFYHHLSNQHPDDGGFTGSFDEFFDQFLEGTVAYGKWTHHLASWIPEILQSKTTNNQAQMILLVHYKDLKADLKGQILRIANFLELIQEEEDLSSRQNEDEWLDQVVDRVRFEYMRENQAMFHPISVRWKPGYHFIRSGKIGDYQTLFTDQHQQRFVASVRSDFQTLQLGKDGCTINDDAVDRDLFLRWLYEEGFL